MIRNKVMNETQVAKISIILFIWGALFFFLKLQYNFLDGYDIALFWISILVMFGVIIYQIFFLENNKFVLFEIFIVYFLLHLVYQAGYYGLRGSDSYIDYNTLKTILSHHQIIVGQDSQTSWPMIHIFSSITTLITKINPLLIAKILPSFITSIIVLPLYLLINHIYKNKKVALFSCLLFGFTPAFISTEALFIREIFAFFIFILLFYVLYVANQRKDRRFGLLSIILIPVVIFSHHFTSFMLIIFLTIYIVVSQVIPFLYRKDKNIEFSNVQINTFFPLLIITIISYWCYIAVFIFKEFFKIYYDITGAKEFAPYSERVNLGGPIATLEGNIIYYGFFFFQGILCLILLITLIRKRNKYKIEDTSFTLFLYFCLFFGFLSLFVFGSILYPDRFLPFGWILGLIPLSVLLFNLKKKRYKAILMVILISFSIYNIYNIDPSFFTGNAHLTGTIATEEEYAIAKTISIPTTYYGYLSVFGAIYDIQGVEFKEGRGKNPITSIDFPNSSTLAIIYKDLYLHYSINVKIKSPKYYDRIMKILLYENFNDVNKICDLGDIYVLKWSE